MQLNADYYETDFEIIYKENTILIRNDGPEGESLYINGVLQDQHFSAYNGRLIGHIFDEENKKVVIEVNLGGLSTADCMIYANGELIHSQIPHEEFVEAHIKEKPVKEKRRNGLLLPFIVIVLIAVCMMLFMPYFENGNSSEDPAGEPANTDFQKESSGTPSPAAVGGQSAGAGEGYVQVHYEWDYGKNAWTYDMKVPKSTFDYYRTMDRKKIKNYSYYATDTSGDAYLAGLADKFKEAAGKENYSDLDMVKNVIFFVQSLKYIEDKTGTGYDEYPKFPLETLADRGGDCDDTAILLASLLRELGYGAVLIQFEDHMAVGVKGDDSIQGSYYEVDGSRYYYVETTSTGWDIGETPDQVKDKPAKILNLD